MLQINATALPSLIEDSRTMLRATDDALLAHAQLLATIVETSKTSQVPMQVTQPIFESILSHGRLIVEGRASLKKSIALMTNAHARSNLRAVATGCPGGFPDRSFVEARAPDEVAGDA